MLISPNHKFIFFKPMKCAGSSVEFALYQNCGEEALCTGGIDDETDRGFVQRNNVFYEGEELKYRFHSHTWPALFYERIADQSIWEEYKKITIVRNPWDMLVSYYWHFRHQRANCNQWLDIKEDDSPDQIKWKFESFLTLLSKMDSIFPGAVYTNDSPINYASTISEAFIDDNIDFYLSFENIQEDYIELCDKLSIPTTKLPRFKTRYRKIEMSYKNYYNKTTQEAVYMRFPKTIEKFGYKF